MCISDINLSQFRALFSRRILSPRVIRLTVLSRAASLADGNMPRGISHDEKYASRNESSIYARTARGELLFFDWPEISHCQRFIVAFGMSSVSSFDLTTKNAKSNIPCNFCCTFSVHVHICKKFFLSFFTRSINDVVDIRKHYSMYRAHVYTYLIGVKILSLWCFSVMFLFISTKYQITY